MGRRTLLVEGKEDLHILSALFMAHQIPECFAIKEAGGVGKVVAELPTQLKASDLERLALVVDANGDPAGRWTQIRDRLRSLGCKGLADGLGMDGAIVEGPRGVRIGIWLMPNHRGPGMIEDFLMGLAPAGDTLLPRVDAFLQTIPSAEQRFAEALRPKARLHAWLAVQEQPGRPAGQALTARYLDPHGPAAAAFITWVRRALV